jgi:diacylglycerol O-acyltransferase / wax synthase
MASADAAWFHMDRPTNLMVINSVLWFDEPVDWQRFHETYLERIVGRFDRFRQRPVDGLTGPCWEDVELDADLHFHHVALPLPGDRRALQALVADRISTPLDPSRPLWEAYLIDGFGAGAALLVRMHHCIADGVALARVMLALTDGGEPSAAGFAAPAPRGSALGALTHAAGALTQESVEMMLHPRRALEFAETAVSDAQTLARLLLPGADPPSAIKGEQRIAHRVAWSAPVDLWRIKRAARALGATVNDVLVSAVTGAVADHLRASGDVPEEIHALVPFNLRRLDEPLPRELGNRFGLVLLSLPVGVSEPVLRTAEVKRRMDAIKAGHEGALSYGILEFIGHAPAAVEGRLIDYFSAKGSMVLTNVPGPRHSVSIAGTPLRGVLVWAPCSGSVGMSVSVFSYSGKVTVGFLTDAGLVPDPQALADAVRTHALALARAAG